jgi:hypothetical protein
MHMVRKARLLAILVLCIPACLPACRRGFESPLVEPKDISLDLGLAGLLDRDRWNGLRLRIANRGGDFRGKVEVRGVLGDMDGPQMDPVLYRAEIEVPGGGTTVKEVSFPVRPDGWIRAEVSLAAPGFSRAFSFEVLPDPPPAVRFLVVGERPPDLSDTAAEIEKLFDDSTRAVDMLRSFRLTPSALPSLPEAYEPFGIVLLWGTNLADAPPGAIEALGRWVEGGGALVAFPGPEWAAGLPAGFRELLAIEEGDPSAPLPDALAREIGEATGGGFYREIRPAEGARSLAGGLAVAGEHGAGRTVAFSFRPEASRFPSRSKAPGIHRIFRPILVRAASFGGSAPSGIKEVEKVVAQDLFALSGFHAPNVGVVLLGVVLYLTGGLLAPFFIFRRRRRPEWAFVAVVVAATFGTLGIYRYGLLSAMAGAEAEEVSVLRLQPGEKIARATSFLGLVSPSMRRVEVPAEAPRGEGKAGPILAQPLRAETSLSYRRRAPIPTMDATILVDADGRQRIEPLRLRPNAMSFLRCDWDSEAGKLLDVEWTDRAGETLKVRNRGSRSLRVLYLEGKKLGDLGAIGAGGESRMEAARLSASQQIPEASGDWMYSWSAEGAESQDDTGWFPRGPRGQALSQVLKTMAGESVQTWMGIVATAVGLKPGGADSLRPRHLIAWTFEPAFPEIGNVPGRRALTIAIIELPARPAE